MSLDPSSGYAAGVSEDASLPIFDVQKVQLRFDISADFVAAQVANNVLILALSTGRILRFDLDNAEDIDDIDLPKRPAEIGVIRRLFLDPSASHLIISTTLGENYYLHTQSRQPKLLSRLKGKQIECIAWNPSQPTASTREILLGATDGTIYETYIEPTTEFYRHQERYLERVVNPLDGPIVGVFAESLATRPDTRRVLFATQQKLYHYSGKTGRQGHEGGGSIYARLFDAETPAIYEVEKGETATWSALVTSPDPQDVSANTLDAQNVLRVFAWLCQNRVYAGTLVKGQLESPALGKEVFKEAEWVESTRFHHSTEQTSGGLNRRSSQQQQQQAYRAESVLLTQFHIVALSNGRITAMNRLDQSIVYNQQVLEKGQACLGLFADHQKNTFWVFSSRDIYEIVVTDETRDVWRILLRQGQYEDAQRYAKTARQRDAVASMTGEHLMSQGKFEEAASLLGRSTKAFEDVSLGFIDKGEHDALRKYLLVKLSTMRKSNIMQRVMLSTWLVELFMAKLNELDDTISTKAELTTNGTSSTAVEIERRLPVVREEFRAFVGRYRGDLDRKTVYEIISSHGREEELLHFANVVDDYDYVMSYWVQRERWDEAMRVLQKRTEPEMFYRYGTVLMAHVPVEFVDTLMRQGHLDPKKLIPAMLNYNKGAGESASLGNNVAVRYLRFCIEHAHSTEPAVHNTLISLYASHPSQDEAIENALLTYLQTQESAGEQNYDADFALRLCIAHKRVKSCVHIYRSMSQYSQAVELALKYDDVDQAKDVANSPDLVDDGLRKKLWLKIARKVIAQSKGIKSAMTVLREADPLLHIEDLIPLFPDFVIIDDFKEEICAALEDYSRKIDLLKQEMDASTLTAEHIKNDIKALDQRYAIVEPGERCWTCRMPLLMRQFFVFPCQHAFHADCLGDVVMKMAGMGKEKRIRELQREIGRGVALGKRREGMVRELDGLVAGACVLCSDMAVRMVDAPFFDPVASRRERDEWAIRDGGNAGG